MYLYMCIQPAVGKYMYVRAYIHTCIYMYMYIRSTYVCTYAI